MKSRKLTPKMELFCREYLKDLNGTAAAIRSGYPEKSAKSRASEMLAMPHVKARVQSVMDKRSSRIEVSADRVLEELMNIAFADIGEIYHEDGSVLPMKDIPERVRRAVAGVEVTTLFAEGVDIGEKRKVRLADKIRALDLLCKHLSLLDAPAERLVYIINGEKVSPDKLLEERAKQISKLAK